LHNNQLSGRLPAEWALGGSQSMRNTSGSGSGGSSSSSVSSSSGSSVGKGLGGIDGKKYLAGGMALSLQHLDLSSNQLSGQLPHTWATFQGLKRL